MIKKTIKNKKFKKIFLIPYAIWFLLTLIAMIPDSTDSDPLTWGDFILVNLTIFIIWFVISFIISYIIIFISNKMIKIEKSVSVQSENLQLEEKEVKIIKEESKSRKLYSCESIINATEYGKMAPYFPKMYWTYVFYDMILNLIFTTIWAISTKSLITTLTFCIIYQLFIMLECKLRLRKMAEKSFIRMNKNGIYDTEFSTEFYNNFFIRKGKTISRKLYYDEINRFVETKTNIYLSVENKNLIIILQKDKCSEELINFLNEKIEKDKKCINKKNNIKVLKKTVKKDKRVFMIILFIVTILSIYGALFTYGLIGVIRENTYGYNIFKDMWTFWLWLPIPVLSIILGFKYKKQGLKCTKNIIGGFIVGFLLLIYGSMGLIFENLNDYTNSIFVITQNDYNDEIKYYEVNYKTNMRNTVSFESEIEEIYSTSGCVDRLNDKKLIFEKCEIKDKNETVIEINELFKDILTDVYEKEDSHILKIKILKVEEKYFVVTELNVNLWTPYVLYEYDYDKKELKYLYTFSSEDVIGIKVK